MKLIVDVAAILEAIAAISPHLVAVVAMIVPAVQAVKIRKLDLLAKEQEYKRTTKAQYYAELCAGYARHFAGVKPVESAALAKESALKLAGFCSEDCREALLKLVDMLDYYDTFVESGDMTETEKMNHLRSTFEKCLECFTSEIG